MVPDKDKWMSENITAWKIAKKKYTPYELSNAISELEYFYNTNNWDAPEEEYILPPRILSRRRIIEKTAALGIWTTLKAMITSTPLGEDLFFASNDVAEDHPMYIAMKPALETMLTEAGVVDIDAWLDDCILERY